VLGGRCSPCGELHDERGATLTRGPVQLLDIAFTAVSAVCVTGLTVLDTTDSAILRLVVDDPERAMELLRENGFPFTETRILVVEVDVETRLQQALSALLEAEINIHYMYPLLTMPAGRPLLAMNLEDHEVAAEALRRHQIRVLNQTDLSR